MPAPTPRFALYRSPHSASYHHLVLSAGERVLMHWIFAGNDHVPLHLQTQSLVVETMEQVPSDSLALDEGMVCLPAPQALADVEAVSAALRQGRLCLEYYGLLLRGPYSLVRLRPEGQSWLLNKAAHLVPSAAAQ
ncbi:hypothetical protein [Hymenobacter sp. B81]|uniref:hypothetical protein n=1 Tax=Hymenobacter sp. B81 TaxID=3344878 RepID=UPI0037DC501F